MKAHNSILVLILTTILQITESSEARLQTSEKSWHRPTRGDDVSLASLQTVIEQQAAAIQTLQEGLQAEKTRAELQADSLNSLNNVVTDLKNANDDLKSEIGSLRNQIASSSKAGKQRVY